MILEDFYKTLYHDLFFKWILSNHDIYIKDCLTYTIKEDSQRCQTIIFCSEKAEGTITIWHNDIVEESIRYAHSQEQVFYLHYTIHDLAHSCQLFKEFYKTLLTYCYKTTLKIAFCGSDGMSTLLLVDQMKDICKLEHIDLQIDSLSLDEFHHLYHEYDLIYLAPQIAHMQPELMKMTKMKVPIHALDATAFATKDYQNIMKTIQEDLKS